MFQDLELKASGVVGFGGNQKGKIIGSGTVGNGKLPSINNVLLVEGLMHNLLSISQLSDNGYDVIFNQMSCKAVSKKMALFCSMARGRITFTKLDYQI